MMTMIDKSTLHPSIAAVYKYFAYEHLPDKLQAVSKPFCLLANDMIGSLPPGEGGPEVTVGLRKLLEAKDCFVRAALP